MTALLYFSFRPQGNGVDRDEEKAYKLIEKAAVLGNAEACYVLGGLFESGDFLSVQVDEGEAKKWMRKARDGNHMGARRWCSQYDVPINKKKRQN